MKIKWQLLLCSILVITGCTSALRVERITHQGNQHYSQTFNAQLYKTNSLNIGFKSDLFTQNEMQSIVDKIESDLSIISNKSHQNLRPISIYVVDKIATTPPTCSEDCIYLTLSDIDTNQYHENLIKTSLGTTNKWKTTGLQTILKKESCRLDLTSKQATSSSMSSIFQKLLSY